MFLCSKEEYDHHSVVAQDTGANITYDTTFCSFYSVIFSFLVFVPDFVQKSTCKRVSRN